MTELAPKVVRLTPKWDRPGTFSDQILVVYILIRWAEIWYEKVLGLSHLGPIWPTLSLTLTLLVCRNCWSIGLVLKDNRFNHLDVSLHLPTSRLVNNTLVDIMTRIFVQLTYYVQDLMHHWVINSGNENPEIVLEENIIIIFLALLH